MTILISAHHARVTPDTSEAAVVRYFMRNVDLLSIGSIVLYYKLNILLSLTYIYVNGNTCTNKYGLPNRLTILI